jgi:hypothetical protein
MALLGIAFSTWFIINTLRSPSDERAFVIDEILVENPVVEPGQPVRFVMKARRFHQCPSIIAAFWMTEGNEAWTRFPPTTGGYTDLNPGGYTVRFSAPAPMENTLTGEQPDPGVYHYKSLNSPLCDNMGATETPPVDICLVVPGKPQPACVETMTRPPKRG